MSASFQQLVIRHLRPWFLWNAKQAASESRQLKINSAMLLTFLGLSLGYLIQVNALATKGYTLKSLERQIQAQKKENELLQLENIEAGSMSVIEEKIAPLHLVRSGSIEHLSARATQVGLR